MKFNGTSKQLAQRLVDDFIYDLHLSVTTPQLDFSKVPKKELKALVNHVEQVLIQAAGK